MSTHNVHTQPRHQGGPWEADCSVSGMTVGEAATLNEHLLNALPSPIIVVRADRRIRYVNMAAEQFFGTGTAHLLGRGLDEFLAPDCPLFALIDKSRKAGTSVSEYDMVLESPRIGGNLVNVDTAPTGIGDDSTIVSIQLRTMASRFSQQLAHRNAGRAVQAMAAMLAHEVKNPLSGIRGAAQLLEQDATPQDRQLAQLIRAEADRIVSLVGRIEMFSEDAPLNKKPVNIHTVLDRVMTSASAGFARHIRFQALYDPSLPYVHGDHDMLIQAFLNLVKNASEVVSAEGGEVVLTTAYRHGVRLAIPGTNRRIDLPLEICVRDNGPGIPEEVRAHIFDPFVTTKANGSGLGLPLVAKIIGDHGGIIEFECPPSGTMFRVLLPMAPHHTPDA